MALKPRAATANGKPRKLPPSAKPSPAAVDLSVHAEVTVVVRSRGPQEQWDALVAELSRGLPGKRRYLTHAELAQKWGAAPADLEAVGKWATEEGLKVVSSDALRRCVVVSGSLEQLSRAFDVELYAVDHPLGKFHTHRDAPRVPLSIHPIVECVLGFDDLPVAEPHTAATAKGDGMNRQALLEAYAVPAQLSGKGQCVAVVDLGGGYYESDMREYFRQFPLDPPRIVLRSIGGVKNDPAPRPLIQQTFKDMAAASERLTSAQANAVMWTWETTTDVALVGTLAPEATILLLLAKNDDQGQYHAITSAIADTEYRPSVLSCSWGGAEAAHTPSFMHALDRWFQTAAVIGMTVCCSTGDFGDGTMRRGATPNVLTAQFPATSPHILACGGTALDPAAGTETAWNQVWGGMAMAGGGGFSEVFPLPEWQRAAGIDPAKWIPKGNTSGNGRAIPDIAAKANMAEGYSIPIGGTPVPAGGTSAAAPLWAGLVALLNEGLKGRAGSLNALFYDGTLDAALRDIVEGDTGQFRTCKGWDACTGWGSPNGTALLRALRG